MAEAAAKKQRTTSKRNFTRKFNILDALLKVDSTPLTEIDAGYEDLCSTWKIVETKHDAYIDLLDDPEDPNENTWIQDIQDAFVKARKEVLAFRAKTEQEYNCSSAKRTFDICENSFTEACASLELLTRSHSLLETLSNERLGLSSQIEKLKEAHTSYASIATIAVSDQLTVKMTKHSKKYNSLKMLVDSEIITQRQESKKTSFRMEKTLLPKFDGKIRDYPLFRKDFVDLVLPSVSTKESSYTLRKCLSREVNEYLGSCTEDVEKMLKRLDLKYGDPSKLVDAILSDLQKFKRPEDEEHEKIIKLIDSVEIAHRDLKGMSLEHELTNSNTVSIIENKLPKRMQMEWYRHMHKEGSSVKKDNKFPFLLKFLCAERDAIQYAMSDIRRNTSRTTIPSIVNTLSSEASSPSPPSCVIHFWSGNHTTADCRTYNNLPIEHKLMVLKDKSACFSCLKPGHMIRDCETTTICTADETCNEKHHPSLHATDVNARVTTVHENHTAHVLLPFMKVKPDSWRCDSLSCLWDNAANVSLITFSKAEQLRLQGRPAKLSVTLAGGIKSTIDSLCYTLCLLDQNQISHSLTVFGITTITKQMPYVTPETITNHFKDIDTNQVERPFGDVHLLIGYEYAGWFPEVEQKSGHFVILSNIFGKCVGGRCSSATVRDPVVNSAIINILKAKCAFPCDEFLTIESLGVQCNPKCGGCRCGTCPLGGKPYSIKEERELKLIEDNLEFKGDHWVAGLPFIKDPNLLPSDYDYVLKRFKANERRLMEEPSWNKVYHQRMKEFISNFARKVSPQEITLHKERCHYVCHHAVAQPGSESTPVRIVWDSSHQSHGQSFNDFLAKGPDAYINTLMSVLLQFREDRIAIVGDVRKMYNSISLRESDQHMHRFFYRTDSKQPLDTYVITVVNIGDRPSGAIATVALRKTALLGADRYPLESKIVNESSYVDDITSSVNNPQKAQEATTNISKLLEPGNFYIKQWGVSGKGDDKSIKTLGTLWNPLRDTITFKIHLNFSKKVRNQRSGADVTHEDLLSGNIPALTRRMVMSSLNSIFDAFGLLVPFTVKGKILLRELWTVPGWDTPLDSHEYDAWINFLTEMLELNSLEFPRSVKPPEANDERNPVLIIFSDGSEKAFGCCAYVRWELKNGDYVVCLLAAKSRVTPLKIITIVRIELSAAVLGTRLRSTVEDAFKLEFSRVIHIIDSQIVKAMISKESYGFNTFSAVRIGEIQTSTAENEWYWVESKDNIADIISRGAAVSDLGEDSQWQNGPPFLKLPIDEWPIHQDFPTGELPEQIKQVFTTISVPVVEIINIERFSNFILLLRVTARILMLKSSQPNRSLLNLRNPLSANHLEEAKTYWIKTVQKSNVEELEKGVTGKGSLRKLNIQKSGDIYVASGRISAWNEFTYNKKDLPIIPASHKFSELYALYIHNQAHRGPRSDIAKIRTEYWITGIQQLVKRIRNNCVTCRRLHGKLVQQIMAPLPVERLKPAPIWHHTAADLFGPCPVKGEVNKRSVGKAYGVIFTCLLTRAVYVDVSCDYSTDAFLLVFRRFVSLRGYPSKIFSDVGSQLVAASKELQEMFNNFDWTRIQNESVAHGLEWKFSPPEAPWYNGCCEALIRSVKKCIYHAIGNQKVSFSELQTTFFECANIVNERPIGTTPSSAEDGSYICPNDMLLGRSSNKPPSGNFDLTINSRRRIYFVQRMVDAFWKKWVSDYFPSLLERKMWHHSKRDVIIGDVVIIQDKDCKRSCWKLGLVQETYPGLDGKVRRVLLKYINPSGTAMEVQRPVQNIVVLLPKETTNSEL